MARCAAWLLALTPCWVLVWLWFEFPALRFALDVLVLYFALGMQSLTEHAQRIRFALDAGDLDAARLRVGEIVSRDTRALDEEGVARAGIESVLENGNDAVFGALFWFVLLGAPGALLFRLANTLDAMWGYRTARFLQFGWAAARIDDVLNFIPARLTATSYALLGHTSQAIACWKKQAPVWDSPNAGPVMASGAGSLNLQLGGAAYYHGELEPRPELGCGKAPAAEDISRAVALVRHSVWLWLCVIALVSTAWSFYA
jgi:adenosylcobinamide-phosphate synthase